MHRITISRVPMAMSNNKISLLWKSHALQKPCERVTIPNSRMQLNSKHFSTSLHSDAISFVQRQIVCKTVKQNRMKHDDKNCRDFSTKKRRENILFAILVAIVKGWRNVDKTEGSRNSKSDKETLKKGNGRRSGLKVGSSVCKMQESRGCTHSPLCPPFTRQAAILVRCSTT